MSFVCARILSRFKIKIGASDIICIFTQNGSILRLYRQKVAPRAAALPGDPSPQPGRGSDQHQGNPRTLLAGGHAGVYAQLVRTIEKDIFNRSSQSKKRR